MTTTALVLYYSSYGHTATMARAVAKGLHEGGASATVKRVSELVPAETAAKAGYRSMPLHRSP